MADTRTGRLAAPPPATELICTSVGTERTRTRAFFSTGVMRPSSTGRRNSSTRNSPEPKLRSSPESLRSSTWYTPSLAAGGMAKLFSALRPPVAVSRQTMGWVNCWPLPTWVMTRVSGRSFGSAKPWRVSERSTCFIDTVSPARNKVRSKMVWARSLGRGSLLVGTLKRQGPPRGEQGAVKKGGGAFAGARVTAGGHVEAPGLDAALPVAPGESHVLHAALLLVARAHEVGVAAVAVVAAIAAAGGVGRQAFDAGHALGIGQRVGQLIALAVAHTHRGALHRLALVQRGHPGQGVFAAELEMHAQVGHQGRGAHDHRAGVHVALIQQRSAELLRGDLHHVEAGRQRYAHHLERARVVARWLGQVQRLHAPLARQQRKHARLHILLVFVQHLGQRAGHVAPRLLAIHHVAVVALHLLEPRNDVGVGARLERAHGARLQA